MTVAELLGEQTADFGKGLEEAIKANSQENLRRFKQELRKKISKLQPKTTLLGCAKHWSDDSSGTCTCDENERTASYFYRKAIDDVLAILKGGSDE